MSRQKIRSVGLAILAALLALASTWSPAGAQPGAYMHGPGAGQGDGGMAPILADAWASGYRGFLSLEPHLKVAGHSHGETGPDLFKVAADALKEICRTQGILLAGA